MARYVIGRVFFFLTTMPRQQLQRQAFQSAQWVLWSGLVSLALVLGFLATTLRRQIAQPLAELTRATKQMSAGDISARAARGRSDELGALARSFNEMAGRVAARDAELRQVNQDLEQRVALRTSELTEANRLLDERRAEALRRLARERELGELKSEFVSLVSHEFRTPLEIIMSCVDNLERYHDRLAAEKREQLLRSIHKSVRRMAGMMEEVLVLGRVESGNDAGGAEPADRAKIMVVKRLALGTIGFFRMIFRGPASQMKWREATPPVLSVHTERKNDSALTRAVSGDYSVPHVSRSSV